MAEPDADIVVQPDGPYIVRDLPLVRRRAVVTEHGEPITTETTSQLETRAVYALCRCGQSASKPFCDGAHTRNAFDGTETAPTNNYDERATTYRGTRLVVRDDRSICVHAGFCGNRVTNVWNEMGGSGTDDSIVRTQVINMVERCPSGAMTYRLDTHGHDIEPDLRPAVAVIADGPLRLTGGITVQRADGTMLETRNRVTLCRSPRRPLRHARHHRRWRRHRPRPQDDPRGPRRRPRRARSRRRPAARRPQRRPRHTSTPTRQRYRTVMDRSRAQRVPHRRPRPTAPPSAAPRHPHRHATRRDRRTQMVRPLCRPLATVGVTHAPERRRPPRRVSTQDPHRPPSVERDRATLDELRRWRRQLRRDGLPCGPDDWMFCNTTGRFLNPESISQLFDRTVQRSGLPRVRFHDLRHTHASLLVADGTASKVVSERLGHAHPAFTRHTYQHLLPGMSAAAAERFAIRSR